ncbi:MAG: AzlD domain-containing protein [Lachnospiraceae bacterium]|jgi:branched-subunit amino acid transport protein AzlD|nr:AzlD domain-containing protein [Lachnospiraceae bacterium]
MMIDVSRSLAIIMVTAVITALIRFAPFLIFHKGTPKPILYLGKVLPHAVMGMLVVYCLKNISVVSAPFGVPECLAILFVVIIHKWKHNTLLSIGGGTLCYMLLVQMVFV